MTNLEVVEMAHHPLGPSSASTWMYCPGSVRLCKNILEGESPEATSGTCTHEIVALCLRSGLPASKYVGDTIHGIVVDDDRARRAQTCVDILRSFVAVPDCQYWIETRVDLSEYIPQGFGTSDFAAYYAGDRHLHIADVKDGFEPVYPDSEQLMIYALGWYDVVKTAYKVDHITLTIIQPRLNSEPLSKSISVAELVHFAGDVTVSAINTLDPKAPLVPGAKQCKYCRGRTNCPELARRTQQLVTVDGDQQLIEPDQLSIEQKQRLYPWLKSFKTWIKSVEDMIKAEAVSGAYDVPGQKIVKGKRGHRKWTDPAAVQKFLKNRKYKVADIVEEPKIKSPAQLDWSKLTDKQKEDLQQFITQASGKPTLAPESDKREAIEPKKTLLNLKP